MKKLSTAAAQAELAEKVIPRVGEERFQEIIAETKDERLEDLADDVLAAIDRHGESDEAIGDGNTTIQ